MKVIDTSTFVPGESRWQDIVMCLQSHGIECYSPGTFYGDITKKFCVVTYYGSYKNENFSSTQQVTFQIAVYVPKKHYSWLEPFIEEVKEAMKDLKPMLKQNGYQTPSYYDDTIKGHVLSIEYINYRFVKF